MTFVSKWNVVAVGRCRHLEGCLPVADFERRLSRFNQDPGFTRESIRMDARSRLAAAAPAAGVNGNSQATVRNRRRRLPVQ